VGSGRPRTVRASAGALVAFSLFLLARTAVAAAGGFEPDRTRLPSSVSGAGDTARAAAEDGGGGSAIVRMVVGLAVVLVVILGVTWLVRTWSRSRGVKSDQRLAVVATTVLAQNRALHLVRVGDELVLVGSAEHSVTPIRVYDQDETRRLESLIGPADAMPVLMRGIGGRRGGGFIDGLRKASAR
jgi:flagellar protein FliO/FliZ